MDNEITEQFNEDYAEFKNYDFFSSTFDYIKDFYDAKIEFLREQTPTTRYFMKYRFSIAHSSLKMECSKHSISPSKLEELTELLKRGL